MRLRLSCRDNSFPVLSHRGAIQAIADLGLEGVDISISERHPHLRPADVFGRVHAAAGRVQKVVDEVGLAVADVFFLNGTSAAVPPLNAVDPTPAGEAWEQLEQAVDLAVALQAPGVTVLPGGAVGGEAPATARRRSAVVLQRAAEHAGERGLRLSFEPHAASVAGTPEDVLELLEAAPDVGVTLDYSHFVSAGVEQAAADALLPRAVHVQARQAAPGHLQATMKTGTIDFSRVVAGLTAAGYDGWIGLEYTWNDWIDEVDTLAQTAQLRDHLQSLATRA